MLVVKLTTDPVFCTHKSKNLMILMLKINPRLCIHNSKILMILAFIATPYTLLPVSYLNDNIYISTWGGKTISTSNLK
jgi:hypothetical protein